MKLPDHHLLGGKILKKAVDDADKIMEITLIEDPIGITLTFDGWINVKNEQLLGAVLITLEGRPYVWKAVDISSERENHVKVIKKTESMLIELKTKEITICAVVTDSAGSDASRWSQSQRLSRLCKKTSRVDSAIFK